MAVAAEALPLRDQAFRAPQMPDMSLPPQAEIQPVVYEYDVQAELAKLMKSLGSEASLPRRVEEFEAQKNRFIDMVRGMGPRLDQPLSPQELTDIGREGTYLTFNALMIATAMRKSVMPAFEEKMFDRMQGKYNPLAMREIGLYGTADNPGRKPPHVAAAILKERDRMVREKGWRPYRVRGLYIPRSEREAMLPRNPAYKDLIADSVDTWQRASMGLDNLPSGRVENLEEESEELLAEFKKPTLDPDEVVKEVVDVDIAVQGVMTPVRGMETELVHVGNSLIEVPKRIEYDQFAEEALRTLRNRYGETRRLEAAGMDAKKAALLQRELEIRRQRGSKDPFIGNLVAARILLQAT